MMRAFTAEELERMQEAQVAAMLDRCDILRLAETGTDSYGKPKRIWAPITSYLECGFGYPKTREWHPAGAETPERDATLRLPLGTDILATDRVTVTHRFGVKMTEPDTYEVVGPVMEGPSGIRVGLRLMTV